MQKKEITKLKIEKEKNKLFKIAIIRSRYYDELTESMEKSCIQNLVAAGVASKNIKTYSVPGSWELPLMAKKVIQKRIFDGVVVFGVIIKGETYHFELIANQVAQALMKISLFNNLPVTFEVLATYNLKQARERALSRNNKGVEAAQTILETIKNTRYIRSQ